MGVSFAGYAKNSKADQWQYLKQEAYQFLSLWSWVASSSTLTLGTKQISRKVVYVNSVSISCYSDTDVTFIFGQQTSIPNIARWTVKAGTSTNFSIKFDTPIKIDDVIYFIIPSVAITGKATVSLYGWYEEVP